MIVAVPAPTPVITPVLEFTVATEALLVDHEPPELPFDVNVVVPLTQIA